MGFSKSDSIWIHGELLSFPPSLRSHSNALMCMYPETERQPTDVRARRSRINTFLRLRPVSSPLVTEFKNSFYQTVGIPTDGEVCPFPSFSIRDRGSRGYMAARLSKIGVHCFHGRLLGVEAHTLKSDFLWLRYTEAIRLHAMCLFSK
jgi:hypothetical protein